MEWLSLLGNLFGIGKDALVGWNERKKVKLENELAIAKAHTEAKIERLKTSQEADIAWENLSISQAGWKDEWFTIILSIPAILCFVPGADTFVSAGFEALKNTPEWYQWAFMIAVGSAFGYRKIADFMSLKKGA